MKDHVPVDHVPIDHGLDLAVLGNGRMAALVDPCSRLVWWCYPRFDGDPIFCRLVAGEEEKGFSDVVLDDMAEYQSEYVRNTAIVRTELTDKNGGKVRITDFIPRFRQYGRVFKPPQLYRIIEPVSGSAAHHHPDAADLRIRQADAEPLFGQQPHPLFRRYARDPAHDRCAAVADRQ